MTIHVTTIQEVGEATLQVDGQLCAENASELNRAFSSVKQPVVVDLSGLQTADLKGIETLRNFSAAGAEIRGASPYIKLLLEMNTRLVSQR